MQTTAEQQRRRGETLGVLAAVASCLMGGGNTVASRYLMGDIDALSLTALRFGFGFLLLLPVALLLRSPWPRGRDWIGVLLLGLLFFAFFTTLFNLSLRYTTAARGSLALSTLPLVTMVAAALLGVERLTRRKTLGVLLAVTGVGIALAGGLASAPAGAWQGDAIMIGATLCMALHSLWARPYMARSSPLAFLVVGMGVGAALMTLVAWLDGGLARVASFDRVQWGAIAYLATGGAAISFPLWVYALAHASPTKVTNTITINPLLAALLGTLLLHEPFGLPLMLGLVAVFAGLLVASTEGRRQR